MDRREFLKTMSQGAMVAGAASAVAGLTFAPTTASADAPFDIEGQAIEIQQGDKTMAGTNDITLEQAMKVLEAARKKAETQGTLMDIAVVDAGANLKAFIRMDDAFLGSIDISIKKARTARLFNMPTADLGKLSKIDGPLFNIEHSNGGLITFGGGIPIKNKQGAIIGAIGVSGSSVENDVEVALAGVKAVV